MTTVVIYLAAATLVTGVTVGLLARMSVREMLLQLGLMGAVGAFMCVLVGLLWTGG